MKFLLSFVYCLIFLFLYGCATYQEDLAKFDKLYYQENPQKAFEFSKKFTKNDLLWQIQNGMSGFYAGDYKASLEVLQTAEDTLNKYQSQNILAKSLANTGSVLLNDNVKAYEGSIYEGVLINYYKALDALSLDDFQNARIEFNRANDRQRRAKEYYQKNIEQAAKELSKDKKSSLNTSKDKIDSILNAQYSNLKSFKIYDGFLNPLISYVSGLFFSLQKDPKGIDLLKETYGMNRLQTIGSDILLFQNHKQNTHQYTWILIEDGKSPMKTEIRFELPILLLDGGAYYFGIALPQLQDGKDFYHSFELRETTTKKFEELVTIDGIIANEFSKQLPFILTRSIISATYKAILQNTLSQNLGGIAGLMGAVFSKASTAADTRITTIFPHKVWLIRIQNDVKKISLNGDGKEIFDFELIDCSIQPSSKDPKDETKTTKPQLKVCKNSNNLIYLRTTKNNIISKLLIGEKNEQ